MLTFFRPLALPARSVRRARSATLALGLTLGLTWGLGLGACHRPHGAAIAYTGASQTYASTEMVPKSVRLVDLRSNEVVFAMDIPVGKQLSLKFIEGGGTDPVYTPDTMLYQVFDLGTQTGKLRSAMNVPGSSSRRVDVTLRQGPEYVTAPADRMLRTDELPNREGWWTPEGGDMPEQGTGLTIYDG